MLEINVPMLRFGEFEGEWVEKKLGDISQYTKGFAFKSSEYLDKGIRVIRVSDLGLDSITHNKQIYISELNKSIHTKYNIHKNNIIITTVGSNPDLLDSAVGRAIYIKKDNEGLLNQNMLKLENNNQVNNKFIHSQLSSKKYIYHIRAIKRGNANQANITVKEFLEFKVKITTKAEQQKIANCLTSTDKKIEQLSQKKTLLESYKKGVMQKIFSQEIRFKRDDGGEFEEWVEKKIKDIGDIVGGGTPETVKSEYWNGNIQWFTPTEIKSKYIKSSKRTINELGLKKSSAKLLPVGTLLLTSRATVGDVGISTEECSTNQGFQSIIVNKNNYNEFIYYWILKNKKELLRRSSGSTFIEISKHEINKIQISLPSLEEQTKIANFLSSIDQKITQSTQEIEAMKSFKKGLLQQMFV